MSCDCDCDCDCDHDDGESERVVYESHACLRTETPWRHEVAKAYGASPLSFGRFCSGKLSWQVAQVGNMLRGCHGCQQMLTASKSRSHEPANRVALGLSSIWAAFVCGLVAPRDEMRRRWWDKDGTAEDLQVTQSLETEKRRLG